MNGNAKRIPVSEKTEAELFVESRRTCNLCWNRKDVQLHHIIPVEKGGDNSKDNLIVICVGCHAEIHTERHMTRNIKPTTLYLYKSTWLDLISRFPFDYGNKLDEPNDVLLLKAVLQQGNRRALFFPFERENPPEMFRSLKQLRVFIQKSGYKLAKNKDAKDHVNQLYQALLEISFLDPQAEGNCCMHGLLGREHLELLEIKRKKARYHLNQIGVIVGLGEEYLREDEYNQMGLNDSEILMPNERCFGRYQVHNTECKSCDFMQECMEQS